MSHLRASLPAIVAFGILNLPVASAAGSSTAADVDRAGFWLSFTLLVITSVLEAALSILWTRARVACDGLHPYELSVRVCGREIFLTSVDDNTANKIVEDDQSVGCGLWVTKHSKIVNGASEATIDNFGGLLLVPTLIIRRFNPTTSLRAPTGLIDNVRAFFHPGKYSLGRLLEHAIHLIIGLADLSLGLAGLILNPGSPKALYNTLKDPRAPMTFDNYSTLFLLYWILGALLTLCMIPMRSRRRSIQMFGWPATIAFVVASLASVVLFALGCWKIDVARKEHSSWTPMLSYWIGGASALGFPVCGLEAFHIFGAVGLTFMLIHTFQ